MKVTRRDVARRAGVSPALVSYALNGGPRPVSAAARARIEAAIEELGYRPDVIAQALRGTATRTIGLLMPSPANEFFAELAVAIGQHATERGNLLTIGLTGDERDLEAKYVRAFVDRRVDGLILVTSRTLPRDIDPAGRRVPTVVLDRVTPGTHVTSVRSDSVGGAARCVEHLQAHGHRLIGCVAGPGHIVPAADRLGGWRGQQDAIGAPSGTELVASGKFSPSGGMAAARVLLDPAGPVALAHGRIPTALFVSSDAQAAGVARVCDEYGLAIPGDVAIVSFDGTRSGSFLRPPLTSWRQPIDEIARIAVEEILATVADPERDTRELVLAGNLVIGETCGCHGR